MIQKSTAKELRQFEALEARKAGWFPGIVFRAPNGKIYKTNLRGADGAIEMWNHNKKIRTEIKNQQNLLAILEKPVI